MNFFEEKETDQEIEERKQKNINANYDTGLYSNDLEIEEKEESSFNKEKEEQERSIFNKASNKKISKSDYYDSNDLVVRIISYLLLLIIIVGAIYIFVTKR